MVAGRLAAALLYAVLLPQLFSCVAGQPRTSVARSRGAAHGPSLEQAQDGTWLQKVVLQGWALPGWPGLRHAFSNQLVDISCPSSQAREPCRHSAPLPPAAPPLWPPARLSPASLHTHSVALLLLQEFLVTVTFLKEVTMRVGHPGRGDQRHVKKQVEQVQQRHCQGAADAPPAGAQQTPAPGSSCTMSVPAVGSATLTMVQPGHPSVPRSPEPCVLTTHMAFSATLLASCLAGMALLLFSHAAVRSPAGQAAIRLYCAVAPVAIAFANVIKLALTGIAVAAVLTLASLSTPQADQQARWVPRGQAVAGSSPSV